MDKHKKFYLLYSFYLQGKLIIETQNYYWSFLVHGSYPVYKAPDDDQTKLDIQPDPKKEKEYFHFFILLVIPT